MSDLSHTRDRMVTEGLTYAVLGAGIIFGLYFYYMSQPSPITRLAALLISPIAAVIVIYGIYVIYVKR